MRYGVDVLSGAAGPVLALVAAGRRFVAVDDPVRVCLLDGTVLTGPYDTIEQVGDAVVGTALVAGGDGPVVSVTDRWTADDDGVAVQRSARLLSPGGARGWRLELRCTTVEPGASAAGWEFFVPGAMYKRNDTDHDGVEDYLGTYVQDYRDDRLGSLSVLAYEPAAGRATALSRGTVPRADTAIPPGDIVARRFVQDTDIGSLGMAPAVDSGQVTLRASYPFSEEYSFCLNTDRSGWAAYLDPVHRPEISVSYRFRSIPAATLTAAIWTLTDRQVTALGTRPSRHAFTLDEALHERMSLTQRYFHSWEPRPAGGTPAGYLVHFSPRDGRTRGNLLEYGFSGAQTLLAYTSLAYGYERDLPLWVEQARAVIDFFVTACQAANGFCQGIYDPAADAFTYWFTGILMPFQYASDEADLRRYLGRQMTAALAPIAAQLRQVEGNYTRTMCESVYPVLLAYRIERDRGREQPGWLAAARRFGDFLVAVQQPDGSWYRAYRPDGVAITSPPEWFGAGDTECKSGTIFPVPVLVELAGLTGEPAYLRAAERAAAFILDTFVDPVEYVGGLNDTTHRKSVKTDAVGVMFVLRSLAKVYEATRQERFLAGAASAARVLASWVHLWDVPFPPGTLLADAGFRSTGWAACDVLPGGSYLDNEFLEFTGDMVKVAHWTGDERLFDIAELVEYGMQDALSMPGTMHGYVAAGIQCEGVMTAYWMSDPDTTAFSGAVNKVKGDDNDTCNGLTNGQMAHALFDLRATYGTSDFTALRAALFPP